MALMAWYDKWFDSNYMLLYPHRDESDARRQVELILNTISLPPDSPVLDLACGNGRHTHLLHQAGYHVTGLDLSTPMLRQARSRYPHIPFIQSDMRRITGQYRLIVSLFTSFGYFESDKDNSAVIAAVADALLDQGWFWLDFLNPDYLKTHLEAESRLPLEAGQTVVVRRSLENDRVNKAIEFPDGQTYIESIKLYTADAIKEMCRRHGLLVQHCFGDYTGAGYRETSERMIFAAQKN